MTALEKLREIRLRIAGHESHEPECHEMYALDDIQALVELLECAIEALEQIRYSNRLPDDFEVLKRISLATHDWSHHALTKIEQILTGKE